MGRNRGGDGLVREFEFLSPADVTVLADRRDTGPWGLAGGAAGQAGRTVLIRGRREKILPGKTRQSLEAGDRLRIETPGGGGFGVSKMD